MLLLKPNCERCDKDLPPNSTEAHICTYECTFCRDCAIDFLQNVCPNCGGGFVPRPIRPATSYREGVSLAHHPAQSQRVLTTYSDDELLAFVCELADVSPEHR